MLPLKHFFSCVIHDLVDRGVFYLNNPHYSGPIQWARGDVGLKPSAAVRP